MGCTPTPNLDSCGPRPAGHSDALARIVNDYISSTRPLNRLAFYASQPSLERALDAVASWKDQHGKTHSHQNLVSKAAKAGAGERILSMRVADVADFEQLLQCVQQAIGSIRGIGDLAVYDAALRLGAFLGKLPERVYLHHGAREGARALGLDASHRSLPMDVFPEEFRLLKPWEVEEVLCIYKDELARIPQSSQA